MLDRITVGPEFPVAAAGKMSRRKQACPIRSIKASNDASSTPGEVAPPLPIIDSPESPTTPGNVGKNCHSSIIAEQTRDEDSQDLQPLVINTDTPPSPPPSSTIDDTPPLTKDTSPCTTEKEEQEDQNPPSSSPGLDIPPEPSALPLSLQAPSPSSPDRPSTPSSLNSSSGQLDSANNNSKQRRGKKAGPCLQIMPVAGNDGKSCWQCPICKEQLESDHDFTVHIRSHNNAQTKTQNTCTICAKQLSSQSSLDRHMLVHSGERPFRCKICDMSFTTNGNMHRHSRIHKKDDPRVPAAQQTPEGGKASKSKSSSVPLAPKPTPVSTTPNSFVPTSLTNSWHRPGVYNPDRSVPLLPKPIMQQPSLPYVPNPFHMMLSIMDHNKRGLMMSEEDVSPSKRPRKAEEEDAEANKLTSPRFDLFSDRPDVSVMGAERDNGVRSAFQVVKNSSGKQERTKSLSKKPESLLPSEQDLAGPSPKTLLKDLNGAFSLPRLEKKATVSSVAVVDKPQSTKNSEPAPTIHDDSSKCAAFQCSECGEQCDSQQRLEFHKLLVHYTNQQAEQYVEQTLAAHKPSAVEEEEEEEEEVEEVAEENLPGFQDLDFMDFTSKKFSLAAKAQCEKVPRKATSKFHNFQCSDCSFSFPNKSALMLHISSHTSHDFTKCSVCQCHFLNPDQLRIHMQTHSAQEAFADSLEMDTSETAGLPESMQKSDFLAMHGLISKADVKMYNVNDPIVETLSKEQNNQYFAKVYKAFAKEYGPDSYPLQNGDKDTGIQMESSSYIPSTHKMIPSRIPSNIPHPVASEVPSFLKLHGGTLNPTAFNAKQLVASKCEQESGLHLNDSSSGHSAGLLRPALDTMSSAFNGMNGNVNNGAAKDLYQCTLCGKDFLNKRALRGHMRTHLGLSQYKCKACDYSSADKSTLIRHMRTHNGERPFMCNLCMFPFTTKANCERHIRKRHGIVHKESMEKCVSFQPCPSEKPEGGENFQSPDTVCQYCGEDLKFLRPLHIHMKTHHNCLQKPFTCVKCYADFSTKSGAIRHFQKQHKEVAHTDIENFIIANAVTSPANYGGVFQDQDEDSDNMGLGYDTGSPSPASTPGASSQAFVPPMAHSIPAFPATLRNLSQEADSPLDCSVKKVERDSLLPNVLSQHVSMGFAVEGSSEEPIDLTVKTKKTTSPGSSQSSLSPSPVLARQGTTPVKGSQPNLIPCHLCNKMFTTQDAAHQHLVTTHQVSPNSAHSMLNGSDNNNNTTSGAPLTSLLPLSVLSGLQLNPSLTGLLQARMPIISAHPAFAAHHMQQKIAIMAAQRSLNPSLLAAGITASGKVTPTAKEPESKTSSTSTLSSGSESGSDLASVNKIIESTATQNIQVFLKPQVINSASEDSEPQSTPWESADEDSDQSLDQLYKQSLNGKIVTKPEVEPKVLVEKDNGSKEGMELDLSGAEEGKENLMENPVALLAEVNAENAGNENGTERPESELSPNTQAGIKTEAGSAPVKKKRNSYADSPHKLKCPNCPRSFPWVSSLNRHMLTHTGQKPFKCSRCNVTFSTKSNRERHLIRKHGVNMLDPASRQTMDRPYKCHLCVFSSFSTESNLLKHYKDRHPETTPPERYLMKMEGEDDDYTMGDMDEGGMDGWSENGSVDNEDTDMTNAPLTKADESAMVENIMAAIMKNATKTSPSKTAMHDDTLHNSSLNDNEDDSNDNEPAPNNFLEQPPSNFLEPPSSNFLEPAANNYDDPAPVNDEPMISHDNESILIGDVTPSGLTERHINPERDNYNVDKITSCWKCGEEFHTRKQLVRHLKEHNIDLPFKCYLCDASYDNRCECLLHQEKNHLTDWTLLKEKNGVDSIESYAERLDRVVEKNCKTGQFVEEAEDCEGSIPIAAAGEEAQAEMVASDYLQRKVYCSLCSKRFWSLQDLRRHMRKHTGERPFKCDKCLKRFTLKHSMMRHRRKHNITGTIDSPTVFSDDEDDVQLPELAGKAPAAHTGSGHKALRQHLAATSILRASLPAPANNIPTTVTENGTSLLSPQKTSDKEEDEDDMGDDILHNLLGVESSTIDQIIDAKGSAASLLGV